MNLIFEQKMLIELDVSHILPTFAPNGIFFK